jgi:two-component system chemotaxis response regulator CheY
MINSQSVQCIVADDNALTRETLGMLLKNLKYDVVANVAKLDDLIDSLYRFPMSNLFLDIYFPDRDSFTLLDEIELKFPMVKVFIITSSPSMENLTKAMSKGTKGFIVKPFNAKRIEAILKNASEAKAKTN